MPSGRVLRTCGARIFEPCVVVDAGEKTDEAILYGLVGDTRSHVRIWISALHVKLSG